MDQTEILGQSLPEEIAWMFHQFSVFASKNVTFLGTPHVFSDSRSSIEYFRE